MEIFVFLVWPVIAIAIIATWHIRREVKRQRKWLQDMYDSMHEDDPLSRYRNQPKSRSNDARREGI